MVSEDVRAGRKGRALKVRVDGLRPLQIMAQEAGISMPDLLRGLSLPPDLFESSRRVFIQLSDYFRILQHLSIAAGDETCHLSARALMPGTTDFVLSNLSGCTNAYEAMKLMARSYNILHGGPYNRVERRAGALVYTIDDQTFPYTVDRDDPYIFFLMEGVLVFLFGMLSVITADRVSRCLMKVYSRRLRGCGEVAHLAFWDVPVRFQCSEYALVFDDSAVTLPIALDPDHLPSANAVYDRTVAMIERRQSSAGRSRSVSERVCAMFRQGVCEQERVARRLGMSVATLRRRLTEEGSSFRALRHHVRNESAKTLLRQRHHVSDVAEKLGYSDPRSFNRAFRKWNGVTPHAYASTMAGGAEDTPSHGPPSRDGP